MRMMRDSLSPSSATSNLMDGIHLEAPALTSAPDVPASDEPKFGTAARLLIVAAFAALICLRLPNVALRGRFLGEEGQFFFGFAWHMPWTDALWHPLGGYLNIVASGSTLLAKVLVTHDWLKLEYAPYVTEAVALFFQTCPAWLILTSRAVWLKPRWAVLLALVMLATPPLTEEVWLNSLHSQFHLAVCAALILSTETETALGPASFRLLLLFLGPLCGPAAIVLLPFFALRAILEKSGARWLQTGALGLGSAIQLALFYSPSIARGFHVSPDVLVSTLFIRHLVLPLSGPTPALIVGRQALNSVEAGTVPWATVAAGAIAFGSLVLLALRRWREAWASLFFLGVALATISYVGAIGAGPSLLMATFAERYSYVPQVLISLSVLAFAATSSGRRFRISFALCALIGLVGCVAYFHPIPFLAQGPDWRAEVARWRADREYRLTIWPKEWFIDLDPTNARCGADRKMDVKLDFCDGYWEQKEKKFLANLPR